MSDRSAAFFPRQIEADEWRELEACGGIVIPDPQRQQLEQAFEDFAACRAAPSPADERAELMQVADAMDAARQQMASFFKPTGEAADIGKVLDILSIEAKRKLRRMPAPKVGTKKEAGLDALVLAVHGIFAACGGTGKYSGESLGFIAMACKMAGASPKSCSPSAIQKRLMRSLVGQNRV